MNSFGAYLPTSKSIAPTTAKVISMEVAAFFDFSASDAFTSSAVGAITFLAPPAVGLTGSGAGGQLILPL